MRDDHYLNHIPSGPQEIPHAEIPEADEIQPLLFDLVKADKVDVVRNLLDQISALPRLIREALEECAASFGSAAMIDLIQPFQRSYFPHSSLRSSIRAANIDVFKHLLSRSEDCDDKRYAYGATYSSILSDVLVSDSEQFFEEWERYIDVEFKGWKKTTSVPFGERYLRPRVIRATAGHPGRENMLITIWEKTLVLESIDHAYLGSALVNVAATICSVRLAKFFVDLGAEVDCRRSELYLTALHHAARQDSAAAAEMMKYLLLQGADPELVAGRAHLRIRDEKGAKGIAQWLGMSWDELVAKTKEERSLGKIA
jgi:Ankyrin repeat